MKQKVCLIILISLLVPTAAFSQSKYLEDGVGGNGFSINTAITDDSLSTIGFSAGYSIGGLMDFGIDFSTEEVLIDSHEGTDINFALLYNLILIKQTELNPINIELEGAYGYTNTLSDYLDSYERRRNAQGFNFGASVFHEFFRSSIVGILVGANIDYKNYITQTWDYDDPNTPTIASTNREENILYGGNIGISFKPTEFPLFTVDLKVFYNPTSEQIEYRPTISIINPDF